MTGRRRLWWAVFPAAAGAAYAGLAAGRWVVGHDCPADPPAAADPHTPGPAPGRYPLPGGLADLTFSDPAMGDTARRLEAVARRLAGPDGRHTPYVYDSGEGVNPHYRASWSREVPSGRPGATGPAARSYHSWSVIVRFRPSAPRVATALRVEARNEGAGGGWLVDIACEWPAGGEAHVALDATHPDLHGFNLWHGRYAGEVVRDGRRYSVEILPGLDDPVPWGYRPKRAPDALDTPERLRDILLAELDGLEARVRAAVASGRAFTSYIDLADEQPDLPTRLLVQFNHADPLRPDPRLPSAEVREAYLDRAGKDFAWRRNIIRRHAADIHTAAAEVFPPAELPAPARR